MAAPRLPFLWPTLFRPAKIPPSRAAFASKRVLRPSTCWQRPCRQFATSPRHAEEVSTQRYGKAQEPAPHLREKEAVKEAEQKKNTDEQEQAEQEQPVDEVEEDDHTPTETTTPLTPSSKPSTTNETPPPPAAPDPPTTSDTKALDSVLYMPGPQEVEAHKPPHLKTPPYVHHFDTYGLVRELTRNSAYTSNQSITIMKGVRQILLDNMDLARQGLVSKSNVENETYLFRAACSELKTELGNSRKSEIERMRTERNQLQHEVDILGQRLGQEMMGLRDELKGLFDDRKMAVRQEQRSMQTKIQELGYKITVALNSDARSEVEGLRWVLTRRAAITLGISAFLLFIGLRYISYIQHNLQEEKNKKSPHPPSPPPHRPSPMEDLADSSSSSGHQDAMGGEVLAAQGVSLG